MNLYLASKKIFFLFLIIISITGNSVLIGQDTIPSDFCINREEFKLFKRINEYRKVMNLPEIALSKSLCYVAKKHVNDLVVNKPDTSTCNFHSWSDKGSWKPCCYERDSKDKKCMLSKPRELTNYHGDGHEIVYWENRNVTANTVFEQWRETSASKAVILNMKSWENYSWQAVGIGIENGFASAWFGEKSEQPEEIKICNSTEVYKIEPPKEPVETLVVSTPNSRFYVIIGSYPHLEIAKSTALKFKSEGYPKAKVVIKDEKIRISLSDYPTNEAAHNAKKMLPAKYKDAWVLAF
jgi:hypothetical protein